MSFQLDYNAINISKVEKSEGVSFFGALGQMVENNNSASFSDLVFLLRAGGASDEQINATIKSGIPKTMELILKGIDEAGFLGEKLEVEKIMAEAKAQVPQNKAK